MLTWYEMENATGYIGFDDDCPCCFVKQDEDGWYWEDSWGFGVGGFDTAEEAKADAENDLPSPSYTDNGFTLEEVEEILGCIAAHEQMEERKLGLW